MNPPLHFRIFCTFHNTAYIHSPPLGCENPSISIFCDVSHVLPTVLLYVLDHKFAFVHFSSALHHLHKTHDICHSSCSVCMLRTSVNGSNSLCLSSLIMNFSSASTQIKHSGENLRILHVYFFMCSMSERLFSLSCSQITYRPCVWTGIIFMSHSFTTASIDSLLQFLSGLYCNRHFTFTYLCRLPHLCIMMCMGADDSHSFLMVINLSLSCNCLPVLNMITFIFTFSVCKSFCSAHKTRSSDVDG